MGENSRAHKNQDSMLRVSICSTDMHVSYFNWLKLTMFDLFNETRFVGIEWNKIMFQSRELIAITEVGGNSHFEDVNPFETGPSEGQVQAKFTP